MWQILQQGYRWADLGAWNYWLSQTDADDSQFTYYAPRAALVKEWDWTFASGATVHRTVGLFNDSHTNDPLTFAWALNLNGTKVAGESAECTVPAGTRKKIDLAIPVPAIEGRQKGELTLTLSAAGQEVFKDTKAVSVLKPAIDSIGPANSIAVYDPAGKIGPFLHSYGVGFSTVENLKSLPASAHLVIIGKDAITADDSTSSDFAAYAAGAHVVVVLEQKTPLQYQALPAEMETSDTAGEVGFPEDLDHPTMKGLQQKDFFTWFSKDNSDLFAAAYVKPTRGARSLIQCGPSLKNTALIEIPVGKGLMLLSQLLVEDKLDSSPVAQQLLLNLVAYGSTYKQTFRDVSVVAEGAPALSHAIDSMGLKYAKSADPLDAIAKPGSLAVISATPENLAKLAGNLPAVQSFTSAGGWIVFNGLTPDGLASYNKIVGVDHLIRPFTQERVSFAPIHDSLLAGVTTSDIAMYSSKRIFGFQEGNYVASDEFNYVVDYDDVAPFATSTFGNYDKIVNGFVSADGWPLIIDFPINTDGSPFDIPVKLPRPETLTELTWIGNTFYWPQTKLNLIFDNDPSKKLSFDVEPNNSPQTLKIDPPRQASEMTLEIAGWQELPTSNRSSGSTTSI
jgi:beta-galactosidase